MQKRSTPTSKDSYGIESKVQNFIDAKSPQEVSKLNNLPQKHQPNSRESPHSRSKSEALKPKKTPLQERINQQDYQESPSQNNIFNRYLNQEMEPIEEDTQQEMADILGKLDTQQSLSNSRKFNQSCPTQIYSLEGPSDDMEDQFISLSKQYENLKKKMGLLEVSLHNETLTNEEQRAYIEILKQSLDIKLEENGLLNFIKSLSQRSCVTEADILIELANVKTFMDNQNKMKERNDENLTELFMRIEELTKENESLKQEAEYKNNEYEKVVNDMTEMLENYEVIKEENDKLNEERNSLLNLVEELNAKCQRFEEEKSLNSAKNLHSFKEKISKIQAENQSLVEKLAEAEERYYSSGKDYVELSKNHASLRTRNEELQKQLEELKKQNGEDSINVGKLNEQIQELTTDYENIGKENEALKRTNMELNKKINGLLTSQQEMKSVVDNNDILSQEKEELAMKINKLVQEKNEQKGIEEQLQNKINTLSRQITEYKKEVQRKEEIEQMNLDLKKEITQIKNLFEENRIKQEHERQSKVDEIKSLYQQTSDIRIELRNQKEDYQRLKIQKDSLESGIIDLRHELDKKQRLIIEYVKEINNLKQIVEDQQEELNLKVAQLGKFERQIEELNIFVDECEQKVKKAYAAEEMLVNDLEKLEKENKKLKDENVLITKDYEQLRKEMDHAKQLLYEIIKNIGNNLPNTEILSVGLKLVNDSIKKAKSEEESYKKKLVEKENKGNLLKEEIMKLEERNQKLSKNETEIYNENKKLKLDLEKVKEEINSQQTNSEKIRTDFDKLRENYAKKQKEEEQNLKEKTRSFEEKIARLTSEKTSLEYIISKYKEATQNGDINDLLEQARNAYAHILHLEHEKLNIQIKIDLLKYKSKENPQKSFIDGFSITEKKELEILKESLSEIEGNIQIFKTKKQSYENELTGILARERERHLNYFELEKKNYQLKAEIDLAMKENSLIGQTRETLEASYNDLLKELRRSRAEDKMNFSYLLTDKVFTERKDYYGKPDLEKVKGTNEASPNYRTIRRALESSNIINNTSSVRNVQKEGADLFYSTL